MCLPNFLRFEDVVEENALTGYRTWRASIEGELILQSEYQEYIWDSPPPAVVVLESDSGYYSYNYNNNYNYYNHNHNNYNNYNHYNNYKHNYNHYGIVKHFGKVAIHKTGYRSENIRIDTLFTIRESDATGSKDFLAWIPLFNTRVRQIAEKYKAKTEHYQDFLERIQA